MRKSPFGVSSAVDDPYFIVYGRLRTELAPSSRPDTPSRQRHDRSCQGSPSGPKERTQMQVGRQPAVRDWRPSFQRTAAYYSAAGDSRDTRSQSPGDAQDTHHEGNKQVFFNPGDPDLEGFSESGLSGRGAPLQPPDEQIEGHTNNGDDECRNPKSDTTKSILVNRLGGIRCHDRGGR